MNKTARTAGLLYLVVVVAGIFSLAYVPSQIVVEGDASATVGNITSMDSLFRLGILAGFIGYAAFLLLPLALYRLLAPVDRDIAALMVAFAVVSVPVSIVNLLNKLDILSLVSGKHLEALTAEQVQAQVMLSLEAYGNGILVSEIFWGLWLFPFGYLVFRSGFLPKVLGVLLMAGCIGYLTDFVGSLLFPGYPEMAIANFVTKPASVGEIGICLWLLVVGAGKPKEPVVRVRDTTGHLIQTEVASSVT